MRATHQHSQHPAPTHPATHQKVQREERSGAQEQQGGDRRGRHDDGTGSGRLRRRRRDGDDSGENGGPETAEIRVWINGADTPQEARDWLKETFEAEHEGSTLTIEEQQWEGLVEKLTTALSSESETPDVVEIGNTQAPTFTSAGAFTDLTDELEDLGGDDLLQGFVDGATVDGATYAVPYYAGSKYVFYRKDLFEKAGLEVPTTTEEFVDTAIALKEANPKPANFSGFWLPGQDWRNGVDVRLELRGRPGRRRRRHLDQHAVEPRVDRGPRDRADALRAGVRCGQGRQRGGHLDAVLRR